MTLSYINTKLLFLTNQRHCIETPYLFTSHIIYHFTIKMCTSLLMYLIKLKQLRSETKIELFKDFLQEFNGECAINTRELTFGQTEKYNQNKTFPIPLY